MNYELRVKQNKKKHSNAFTLVELLVVIAIISIIGIFAFANYGNLKKDQDLRAAAASVHGLIRLAQANSTARLKCGADITGSGANWIIEFKIDRITTELKCQIPANPLPAPISIQTITLSNSITVDTITGDVGCGNGLPVTITYSPLYGGVSFTDSSGPCLLSSKISVNLKDSEGNMKTITVNKGGSVEIGDPGISGTPPPPSPTSGPTPTSIPTATPTTAPTPTSGPTPTPTPTLNPIPVAFNAKGTSAGQDLQNTSHTHNVSGSNRYLIVGVAIRKDTEDPGNTPIVTGVQFGLQNFTIIGVQTDGFYQRVEMWGLVSPNSGSNSIIVTLSGWTDVGVISSSWTGVNQTSPLGSFASAAFSSVSISSAPGDMVVDMLSVAFINGQGTDPGAGQTSIGSAYSFRDVSGLSSYKEGASVMQWTITPFANSVIGAVSLKRAP